MKKKGDKLEGQRKAGTVGVELPQVVSELLETQDLVAPTEEPTPGVDAVVERIFGAPTDEHKTRAASLPPLLNDTKTWKQTGAHAVVENEIAAYQRELELAPAKPTKSKSTKQREMEKRVGRMQQRRAATHAQAAERSTARIDTLVRELDEKDRKKELATKVAQAEVEMARQEELKAWEAEQAALRLQHETERRLAELQAEMPRKGLSIRAHLAMLGLVSVGLLAVSVMDRDPGSPSREQASATMSPDANQDIAAAGGDYTQPIPVENTQIGQPVVPEHVVASTEQVDQSYFVPEQPVATVLEAPLEAVGVQQPDEQLELPQVQAEQEPAAGDAPDQAQGDALSEFITDMGTLRKITIGPLTIKKGLFGKLRLHHDDIPGWVEMNEHIAEKLLDDYQVDVARGFASSSAYAMTAGQFTQMMPDTTKAQKGVVKKQQNA